MTDLRACVMGRHDIRQVPPAVMVATCWRCGQQFPMGVPALFSKDGLTSNTYAPRPGILGDAP